MGIRKRRSSEYLFEVFAPGLSAADVAAAEARARAAADELSRRGVEVRYLRAIYLPDEETCFHLFESPSAAAVVTASADAELGEGRIVETLALGGSQRMEGRQ